MGFFWVKRAHFFKKVNFCSTIVLSYIAWSIMKRFLLHPKTFLGDLIKKLPPALTKHSQLLTFIHHFFTIFYKMSWLWSTPFVFKVIIERCKQTAENVCKWLSHQTCNFLHIWPPVGLSILLNLFCTCKWMSVKKCVWWELWSVLPTLCFHWMKRIQ